MTALRPVAWEAWVAEAKVWLRLHPREDHRGVPREERQRSFPKRAALWSLRLKTHLDETSEPNLANFAGSGRIPGARLVRCGRSTPFAPSATPITLSVDHARSWAVVGSGPRCKYHTARLHRTQRLPRPDWQVCSSGAPDPPLRIPLADVSPDGTLDAAQLAQMVAAVSPERTTQ